MGFEEPSYVDKEKNISSEYAKKVADRFAAKQNLKDIIAAQNFPAKDTLNWQTEADPYEVSAQDSKGILQILKDNLSSSKLSDQNYMRISYAHLFNFVKKLNTESSQIFDINVIEAGDKIYVNEGYVYVSRKTDSKYASFNAPLYPWNTASAPVPEAIPEASSEPEFSDPTSTPETQVMTFAGPKQIEEINGILEKNGVKITVRSSTNPMGVYLKHEKGKEWFISLKTFVNDDNSLNDHWTTDKFRYSNLLDAVEDEVMRSYNHDVLKYIDQVLAKKAIDSEVAFYKKGDEIYFSENWSPDNLVWKNIFGRNNIDEVLIEFNTAYKESTPSRPDPDAPERIASELDGRAQNWNIDHPNAAVKSMIVGHDHRDTRDKLSLYFGHDSMFEYLLVKAKEAGVSIENYNFVINPRGWEGSDYLYEQGGQKYIVLNIYNEASDTALEGIKKAVQNY